MGFDLEKRLASELDRIRAVAEEAPQDKRARDRLEQFRRIAEDLKAQLTGSLSDLKDVDFAEAISRLNQQMVGLQAAQAAYSRIGQMSLFDYLR